VLPAENAELNPVSIQEKKGGFWSEWHTLLPGAVRSKFSDAIFALRRDVCQAAKIPVKVRPQI